MMLDGKIGGPSLRNGNLRYYQVYELYCLLLSKLMRYARRVISESGSGLRESGMVTPLIRVFKRHLMPDSLESLRS